MGEITQHLTTLPHIATTIILYILEVPHGVLYPETHKNGLQKKKKKKIVAPWIKYDLTIAQPKIAGTFGKNYPVIIRGLCPTPVNYLCPILTPSQLEILDSKVQCGEVIDWILTEHCPKDLLAGVLTYCHYQEAQYATQHQINALQERHMHYLEKRMEALSALENANILGCILAHIEDFDGYPKAYSNFFKSVAPFHGHITYSGTNTAIDHYMSRAIALGLPALACTPTFTPVCVPCPLPINHADQIKSLHDYTCYTRTLRICKDCDKYLRVSV